MDEAAELRAAHARIQKLELEIARRKNAKAPSSGGSRAGRPSRAHEAALIASLLFLALFCVFPVLSRIVSRKPQAVVAIPASTGHAPVVTRPLSTDHAGAVVTTLWNGPVTVGEDFIALFQNRGAVSLVRIGGTTHDVVWRTPHPHLAGNRAHTFLKAAGEFVLVADFDRVRAYTKSTGKLAAEYSVTGPIRELCPFEDGSPRVYVEEFVPDHGRIIDLQAKTTTADVRGGALGCHGRNDLPLCAKRADTFPCMGGVDQRGKTLSRVLASFETRQHAASVGWRGSNGPPYFGAFYEKATSRITWEGRLSADEDAGTERGFHYTFAGYALMLAYKTKTGGTRVVARNVTDGSIAWTRFFGDEGWSVQAFNGTTDRLYVSFDDRIVILDPKNGSTVLDLVTAP